MTDQIPVLTRTFSSAAEFRPEAGSVYVCGRSAEVRSEHHKHWSQTPSDIRICEIVSEERDRVTVAGEIPSSLSLRSEEQLSAFWRACAEMTLYVDITGLRHGTWAALLRGLRNDTRRLLAIYVEPNEYRMSPQPTENEIYDLSEKIEGIAPLPGFAKLRRVSNASVFVPLLGFEGTRLQYLINQVEPDSQMICPIVGVPGFRAEYPFITYWANRTALRASQAWKKIRLAPASCPFATLNALNGLHRQHPDQMMTLAPIGTKPQSLAAVIFALRNPNDSEIVYDHPVRKSSRTDGISRLHVYDLTGLVRS